MKKMEIEGEGGRRSRKKTINNGGQQKLMDSILVIFLLNRINPVAF
jgi:hypothetical protein